MDKVTNEVYANFTEDLKQSFRIHGPTIKGIRDVLQAELQPEEDAALYGRNNPHISDEILRRYISITRDIRAFLFDNLDTHLLTIEKLADMILCRRRAYERKTKDTTRTDPKGTVVKRVPSEKTVVTKTQDAINQISQLSPEELKKLVEALGVTK